MCTLSFLDHGCACPLAFLPRHPCSPLLPTYTPCYTQYQPTQAGAETHLLCYTQTTTLTNTHSKPTLTLPPFLPPTGGRRLTSQPHSPSCQDRHAFFDMNGLADSEAFKACYAQFRQSDNDRDILISQLLSNYEDLQTRYQQVVHQLQDEKENREIWQRETRDARKQLNQSRLDNVSLSPSFSLVLPVSVLTSISPYSLCATPCQVGPSSLPSHLPWDNVLWHNLIWDKLPSANSCQESQSFVVMIIDGDGAKFRDDYFRAGDDGGGQAAQQLKTQIRLQLQETYRNTSIDNWNILVFFYANMNGLAKCLASRRILNTWTDLQKFASGFGRANSLFSFVDVGYGKDKADHKCQAMLKQMLHATSCRQYVQSFSRYGYLPVLYLKSSRMHQFRLRSR